MSYSLWFPPSLGLSDDYYLILQQEYTRRLKVVWTVQNDLLVAAQDLGQDQTQAVTKLDELFATFAAEWSLYAITGSLAIATAIENDTTLTWLDTVYPPGSGVTIRERLLNRLT